MDLAPIGLSVYTRISHFKRCIEALKKNELAKESNLFIYSDAANDQDDWEPVNTIREFARSINGFKNVHLIEREENFGGVRNAHAGITELTKCYGMSIALEDDIVTAPGFLSFMNEALDYYKNDERVMSITGYCPPIDIPDTLLSDSFCMARFSGWGCGVYNRTITALKSKIELTKFEAIEDQSIFTKFGPDVLKMVSREAQGLLDAADVRCMYQQAINGQMTIYPKKSLVQNIGHDGSGVHCGNTNRFHHDSLWDKINGFKFGSDLTVDESIRKANYEFRTFKNRNG